MKRSFLFVVLFCIFCIKNRNLKQDYFTGFLIRTTLNSALDYLKRIGYIEIIREISLTTPTILNDVIMEKFQLKNLSLYGLSTLNYRDTVVVDDLLDNNVTVKTIILKLNASLDTLGVGADYDVSMKFLSILPLRIKSRISIAFNNINIHLILIINNRNKNYKIQHLELHWCFSRLNNENEYHLIESINESILGEVEIFKKLK